MPLLSGPKGTTWAPRLLVLLPRSARNFPVGVKGQLGLHREIATSIVGEKRLAPLPAHFTGQPRRRAAHATSTDSG